MRTQRNREAATMRGRLRPIMPLRKKPTGRPVKATGPVPAAAACGYCGETIPQEPLPHGGMHIPGCFYELHVGPPSPLPNPPKQRPVPPKALHRFAGYPAVTVREIEALAAHAATVLHRTGQA